MGPLEWKLELTAGPVPPPLQAGMNSLMRTRNVLTAIGEAIINIESPLPGQPLPQLPA